ncbi:HpcH/HpaI aldolase [Halovivax asiaticus JCM 14624]|uniref:HpcH/HpaI aldolase n=1 Tax=Halovivax asiaticus JCM 14624 TaxID=1227490 RepID=M0BSV6_9EURY|nr:L-malyl-CoA/beta-methylmalyl-CoA lyase [Halovivax asiaticus]ELZ14101.1 HpcH/HpaI aldolase [Halovivax asiaticus JCM 14624]
MTTTDTTRLCRSFQTAPAAVPKADTAKYLRSGLTAEGFEAPDWLVPDLEDGTAPSMKDEALENTVDLLGTHDFAGECWPRVEWSDTNAGLRERGRDQIETLVREVDDYVDGVVVPKVGGIEDFDRVCRTLADVRETYDVPQDEIGLAIILETAQARSALREIARRGSDSPLSAIVFGPVDYTAQLGGRDVGSGRPRWDGTLEALSIETSANDLLAIGGPFDELFTTRAGVTAYQAEAYADQIEHEAHLGLDGSWSLHPKQTVQANHVHMPLPDELDRAIDRIERATAALDEGTGAVSIDGQMIDEATIKNFRNTVSLVRAIDDRAPQQTASRYDEELLSHARDIDLTRP